MFDHLDDPNPFVPSADLQPAVERRGRSLRRRRHAAAGTFAAAVLVLAGIAGATTVVDRKLDDVERVEVANLREDAPPGDPKVVLFVGADSDDGLEDATREGPFRTDTIILARVDPGKETLTVLPLPRDLWVEIPGQGAGRINAAHAIGGADLLVDTIDQNLGIEVDHYVEADFAGAVRMGDALGGVSLAFDQPVRDGHTGLAAGAGCTAFDGTQLLALARSRHLQYEVDGSWRPDPTSDLGRIERQQAIGAALLAHLAELDLSDPAELNRLLDSAVDNLKIDSNTSNDDLIDLFRGIEGSTSRQLRYPVEDDVIGGAQVLQLGPGADSVTAAFLDVTEPQTPKTPTTTTAGGGATTTGAPTSTTVAPTTTTTMVPVVPSTPAEAIPEPC